jgi:hypothetical protein
MRHEPLCHGAVMAQTVLRRHENAPRGIPWRMGRAIGFSPTAH